MKSSNPVLGRLSATAYQPTYQAPGGPAGYGYPDVNPTGHRDVMSIDDVVVKTVSLLGAAVLAAAVTWALVPVHSIGPVWIGSMLVGLVLGLAISFAQITNPVMLFGYAVVEGVFLGAVSKAYETRWNGIVLLAVIATLSVFFVMAALYKARIIRASAKFIRIVIGAAAGLAVVMLVNVVITMFTGSAGPLRDGGPFAILFSLVCIVVAALMFVVTFNQIEEGIAAGLPRKHGWLAAFGILVELVWLYLEFLRLISYFQED
ncbi:Bax inhibitor-1/YccA family protein [Dactylosporangium sp. AC04546]|uniref:Bax inhibitor-1/YccA family protein n=1 Tax=Dactylosporangium sp. AC04546 TaxID=2862460 RepID=UPI001EE087DD|nr:Bax inhibitor-1/YccA family protein [Dactylosporangium sp. AC04546]WVK86484.1 Bax inhibitor-1/YccA family protein [Dactylosporangium sp. AC04546]